ncbi:MAG: two-component regulator propeller domain-containing protein [Chitinophagales bacterium]
MQRKLLFLACLFICAGCFAQQYPFVSYTPKDGLANSRVRSIKQDSKGRMIFLTYGGLSIYDGTRFINYNRQDGLANELVNDIVEVGPDSFLVATNAPKLNTLVRGKIGTYKTADNFYPVINRFLKSKDGSWYVTADDGLFILENNRFICLPLLDKNGSDIGLYLDKILEWKNYFLIIPWGDNLVERLIVYDRISRKVTDIDMKHSIFNLATDGEARTWVATNNGSFLIDTFTLLNGRINLLPPSEKLRKIAGNIPFNIFFDKENNIWLYDKDILKISPDFQQQHITAAQGLEVASLTNLFIDREGTVWIATDGNGIIKMRNTNTELIDKLDQRPIVLSTITNQNDTLWTFNMTDNTVYRYSDNKFKLFPLADKNIRANSFFVRNQRLYLNTGGKLLFVKDKDDNNSYFHLKAVDAINAPNGVGPGIIDRNGVIIQYVRETSTLLYLYVLKDDKLLMKYELTNFVDQMAIDRQGRLWMGTRDNHILMFTLHPDQPSKYLQLERDYSKELPELNPRAITVDKNNDVWIGTRLNGVYRLEFKEGEFKSATRYTTQNGLTDNFIYTLSCDSNNTVWIGTQTGLDKIFLKNGRYIIGNVSKNNNFFQTVSKIVVTKNNTVWALTIRGIILKISESPSLKTSVTPPLLFTALEVNNKPYTDSTTRFSFRQNNLAFTVAATSFIDEKSVKYRYLLEGSGNNAWSEPSNNSKFNFINLSPGHYKLNVRSDFPEEMYPPQVISYSFTILPPWWETWWFRIAVGLLVTGFLIFITRFYYRRKLEKEKIILEKQQAIEKERTRIATDMHDDLGAGLSRIKFLSETIGIKKQKQLPFEDDISKIREYSHEMIDKMGEIVWALNEKNDSVSDLLSYTRSYTVEYLSQSGVGCTIDLPELLPSNFVSGEFRRNIFLSVKEILHNIVKHSQANHVTISIQINDRLCINIKDDGIGFDRSKIRPYSNGLINIEKRMKDIGGIMDLQNSNGTLVRLTVPLN